MITVKGFMISGVVEHESYPTSPFEVNGANMEFYLPDGWAYDPISGSVFGKNGYEIMLIEEAKNKKYLKAYYMDDNDRFRWTRLQYKAPLMLSADSMYP